jgi:[acyl-carrier-protein] S-malonyltransferase
VPLLPLQPALFVAGLAAVERLRAQSPATVDGCSACAGLSLGEYTALVFAGALSFEDGLKVSLPCWSGDFRLT